MAKKIEKTALELRGQLMLQVSAGRFFRPGVELNERLHRGAIYTNVWFLDPTPVELPVGTFYGLTEHGDVGTALLEVMDRLEAQRWDGTDEFLVATAATPVGLLSNRTRPTWTPDEWSAMASARHELRHNGKEQPLPPAIDTLIQLEAADQLEAAGRHEEAVVFAANAVEESPGNTDLIAWEQRLLSGNHDPNFGVHRFLFGVNGHAGEDDETVARPAE